MDYHVNPERHTQNVVIQVLESLGYQYLGDYQYHHNNSNIESELLTKFLTQQGYRPEQISKTFDTLRINLSDSQKELYATNRKFYQYLRYGVGVKVDQGEQEQTVFLIDWKNRHNNHFYVAEEVTLKGVDATRRPDLVLYINGIAIGVIELKRGSVSLDEGIAQLVSNQAEEFNPWFFATTQLLIAGNSSQGLRYGATLTPAKYYLSWKEDIDQPEDNILNKYIRRLCRPERILEIIYDAIIFDNGTKKLPRVHQYFGLKAAQEHIARREGGIIWHTQGAGKSILMVLLAKWLLQKADARVMVVTDRDELDKQIERVFTDVGQKIYKAKSGAELMQLLKDPSKRLISTLIHKFGQRGVENTEVFLKELAKQQDTIPGDMVIFVDECHRTQSGDLHKYMKAIVPGAIMIGFTGTPLLKKDVNLNSLKVFGGYIHTYLYKEAVEDGVVLDLAYESRDVDQYIQDQQAIDNWFEGVTQDLNQWQITELQRHWGTRQRLNSSQTRMMKIIMDINQDFRQGIPRLRSGGTAILVASSIYEACKYYELTKTNSTELRNRCAVITSYEPNNNDLSKAMTDFNTQTEQQFVYEVYKQLLANVRALPGKTAGETYIDASKSKFINQPDQMKLLIVVDKLLTGFDAPSCSVLYIDKSMQDHGLFQAICRTNRLDGPDKEYGLIIDYKNLFEKMAKVVAVYSSEMEVGEIKDTEIDIRNRQFLAKKKLDDAMQQLELLMQMINPNQSEEDRLRYFVGISENPEDIKKTEPRRVTFYNAVASFFRAYANAKDDLIELGYGDTERSNILQKERFYFDLREKVRLRAGEFLDTKPYDADMRYLIDNYIDAKNSVVLSSFENKKLIQVILDTGLAQTIQDKLSHLGSKESVAETIENNVRSTIIKDHMADPLFQAKMSQLLAEVIKIRKEGVSRYTEYLKQIEDLIKHLDTGSINPTSSNMNTPAKKALFNLLSNEEKVSQLHEFIIYNKPDGFTRNDNKKKKFKKMLKDFAHQLGVSEELANQVFDTVLLQAEYQ